MSSIGSNNSKEIPDEDDAEAGLSCTLDMFREYEEVQQMITDIPMSSSKFMLSERGFEHLKTILDQYQEQPHLLDPHLQKLLNQLIGIITDQHLNSEAISLGFQYLWLIVKVRGYKTVLRKMPHEVKDLLPVLNLLEKKEFEEDFYGSYILLMWLSIIIYMPFNMTSFDASMESLSDKSNTVVERIFAVVNKHLKCAQSSREMAAYLASRFVTRIDLNEKYLRNFIDYSFDVLDKSDPKDPETLFHRMGVLRALGLIFKHGKREEMLEFASDVVLRFFSSKAPSFTDTPLRKYSMKLIQRIGLTFLRPKLASWRYQRGSRSLATNVDGFSTPSVAPISPSVEDENYDDVPAEIEEVIGFLLQGLGDQDTVVRWSAAKGIGRVTERLPQSLADDVLGEILQLFSTRESDKSWHGACLALAELARRGLLLPKRLPDVMPILEKALVYDELRGQCSVGANIRDAACYLCWAFARAYHPEQLAAYVNQIATGLLIVALFDREIPCRRAGSAAFQEHVGRQGNFPHGIEILTTVDYFAVGNRSNAYLNLSVTVGRYPDYTKPLIDHLVEKKIGHWDSVLRELTAKALHNLTALSPDYMGKTVLPKILTAAVGPVLITRHGSIMASGHIIHALFLKAQSEGKQLTSYVERETLEKVFVIVPKLEQNKLYKGMGGEYMRQATSVLIEKCSLAQLPLEGQTELVDKWHGLMEDCVLNFEENIRTSAVAALRALWVHCFQLTSEEKLSWRENIVKKYTDGLKCGRESQCLGYASALGHMPKHLLAGKFSYVLGALVEATKITPQTAKWALTRKEAIVSIMRLSSVVGVIPNGDGNESLCHENLDSVCSALLNALDDYTMDRRGDIGAWVREAAMQALQSLVNSVLKEDPSMLNPIFITEMMTRVCQQSVERIDRTRRVAGQTFQALLHSSPRLPHIPDEENLRQLFPLEWCQKSNWASESSTYPKFVHILDLPTYRPRILLGLTYALGGVSANLSRYTLDALQTYLNDRIGRKDLLIGFIETVLELFQKYQKDDRIILPLIKSLSDLLGSCSALDQVLEEETGLMPQLLTCLKNECLKCSDYHKLSATVTTLCEILRIQTSSSKDVMTQLTIFLGYQYPKVRALTATSFLTALLDYNDKEIVPEECLDEVISLLEDTPWMESMEQARTQRNKICTLIGVPVPQPKKRIQPI